MTITATVQWKGGDARTITDIMKRAKPVFGKYGCELSLGLIRTGPLVGEWFIAMRQADRASFAKCEDALATDPSYQALLSELRGVAQQTDRTVIAGIEI